MQPYIQNNKNNSKTRKDKNSPGHTYEFRSKTKGKTKKKAKIENLGERRISWDKIVHDVSEAHTLISGQDRP